MDRQAIRHLGKVGRAERRRGRRIVSRRLKPGTAYQTGAGSRNHVVSTDSNTIKISSSRGTEIRISMNAVISAGAYLFRVRLVERKELEVFNRYNSSLFGLLSYIFDDLAKICRHNRYLRLVLKGIRFFLAGGERNPRDLRIAKEAGAKYVLMSYFFLRDRNAWKEHIKRLGLRVLLDSGAFSLHRARQRGKEVRDILLEDYCQFIREHEDILEGYFVLDVVGDPHQTRKNLQRMEEMGLSPLPVFHLGSPYSELQEMVDAGYPVIGLGGTVNAPHFEKIAFLETVFNNFPGQCFHGLGISDYRLLARFEFFSCDSRTWLAGRTYRRLVYPGKKPDNPLEIMAANVEFYVNLEEAESYHKFVEERNAS